MVTENRNKSWQEPYLRCMMLGDLSAGPSAPSKSSSKPSITNQILKEGKKKIYTNQIKTIYEKSTSQTLLEIDRNGNINNKRQEKLQQKWGL